MLKAVKQPPVGTTPPDSTPLAFDIKEKAEAVALEREEEKAKEVKAKAENPRKLITPEALKPKTRSSKRRLAR